MSRADGVVRDDGVSNGHAPSSAEAEAAAAAAAEVGASMAQPEMSRETSFDVHEEDRLVKLMRASVVKLNPDAEAVDDATLRRFLRARQRRVDKATDMFIQHFDWRRTYVPNGYVSEKEIPNELGAEKVFLQGRDKLGRPVGVIIARKHEVSKRDIEEFKKFCVYNFDKCVASMIPGEEKFSVLVDLQGLAYKNLDPRGWTVVFDFLQAHYPERIGKIFLIHVPYIFWGAWKIVNRFIDKRTREKILIVDDKHLEAILMKEIDREQLPKFCGGELEMVLIQDVQVPGWPPKDDSAKYIFL